MLQNIIQTLVYYTDSMHHKCLYYIVQERYVIFFLNLNDKEINYHLNILHHDLQIAHQPIILLFPFSSLFWYILVSFFS